MKTPSRSRRSRLVVVTGGTRGLGRVIARAFATRGHRVWVIARNEGGMRGLKTCNFAPADVCNEQELTTASDIIRSRAGKIDVWINNAGGGQPVPFGTRGKQWRRIFDVNFFGTLHGCLAALAVHSPATCIINIASLAGLMAPARHSAYATAKAGVIALTRSLAVEYATMKIRINAIAPGPLDTPGFRAAGGQPRKRAQSIPTQQLVQPAEIASACLWLSEPSLSLTGHTLVIDGGATAAGCYRPPRHGS